MDYTTIALRATDYKFNCTVDKVTNKEVKLNLVDTVTGKDCSMYIDDISTITPQKLDNIFSLCRQRLDVIA